MSIPIKIELFSYEEDEPCVINHYDSLNGEKRVQHGFLSLRVNLIQSDFSYYKDFPTTDRLVDILIHNNQESYTKLWLDDDGNMVTRIKISKIIEENQLWVVSM